MKESRFTEEQVVRILAKADREEESIRHLPIAMDGRI